MSFRKAIDFTLHLTPEPSDMSFEKELNLSLFDPASMLVDVRREMDATGIASGNVMILDADFLRGEPDGLIRATHDQGMKITTLIDPRDPDALDLVDVAVAKGVNGIKFHPYFLDLVDSDFPAAVAVARRAEEKGLWIVVCCSYGTKRVFSVSGVRLVAVLSQNLKGKIPLIGLPGGGKAVIELMSIAFETPYLFMETSYSLPFWIGSSAETDFVFAMRKLGADRWIYGSDHPFMPMRDSHAAIFEFLGRHGFCESDIEKITYRNANRHFGLRM